MFLNKLFKKHEDYTRQISEARKQICEADAIMIGIGSGLSEAGGLDYTKSHLVKEYFKDYYRMGYRHLNELQEMYAHITDENAKAYWGYWARYIKYIGYEFEVGNAYKDLLRLVRNRNYFICTTNVDAQAQKAGFKAESIFSMQGDCRFLICNKPCCDKVYESEELLDPIIKSMGGNLEINANKIPRCPYCGNYLVPNVATGQEINREKETTYRVEQEAYAAFVQEYREKKVVFLELGVGTSMSQAIRLPFEEMTRQYVHAKLIRMNKNEAGLPQDLEKKGISIQMDLEEAVAELASGVISM